MKYRLNLGKAGGPPGNWWARGRQIAARTLLALSLAVGMASAQLPDSADIKLPNGKSWSNEIAKADHQNNLRDAKELSRLTAEIEKDLEKGDQFVLSLKTLKKVEDAEKLIKNLRTRMRRN